MNNKTKTEKIEVTLGQRLLEAREILGLSREIVAEQLCLRICTVRHIEEDNNPCNINPTFLRGYIRSYAKLVKIPEKEILELLHKHTPAKVTALSPMHSYSLGKIYKKRELWLMKFTWLIIIICVAMIGIWWWQGYKSQKQEITKMAEHNYSHVLNTATDLSFPISNENFIKTLNNFNIFSTKISMLSTSAAKVHDPLLLKSKLPLTSRMLENNNININIKSANLTKLKKIPLYYNIENNNLSHSVPEKISTNISNIGHNNEVMVSFQGKCWLEVRNAKGKILFSGIKKTGQKLFINSKLPYYFNVGIPSNIHLFFNGDYINLSRFIKINHPARFKLPEL